MFVLHMRAQLRFLCCVGVLRVALLADAHLLFLLRSELRTRVLGFGQLDSVLLTLRSRFTTVATTHDGRG